MDIFLESLKKSIEHLQIVESIFSESDYPEVKIYKEIKKNISEFNEALDQNKFSEELYVGGKKRNSSTNTGYARQMILSDVIEYIINGRGYYYAVRSRKAMNAYIRIILEMVNQLMIFDSLAVDVKLRREALVRLKREIGPSFFKEKDREIEHDALYIHDSPLGFPLKEPHVDKEVLIKLGLEKNETDKAISRMEAYYDSLLPKTAGGLWGELLVYIYLLRKDVGFIFPLFLNQRLLSGTDKVFLKPPDLLLLPYGKETFVGIEVGAGKDAQTGNFSIITGIPTATKANADNPKRCCICGKWMLFCPKVVREYSNIDKKIKNLKKPINCLKECDIFKRKEILAGKCFYAMHKGGKPKHNVMQMKSSGVYHFHLSCLKKDPNGAREISEGKIVMYYPYVDGLEKFDDLHVDIGTIQSKIDEFKCELSKFNYRVE